jgi:glycosyltransferase involved in cell wall biosynthesis
MNPTVSVLLPVYQPRPDYFHHALHSILRQEWTDFEVLLIEAHEHPSPSPACRRVLHHLADPRIRYLAYRKPSLVDQLNLGLQSAHGEFIARMDADDWSHPQRLSEQVAYLRQHPEVAVVGTQIDVVDPADRPLGHRRYPTNPAAVAGALCRFNPLAHPSVMYRRATVMAVGGYCYRRHPANEDYELWCRLARHGHQLANLPRRLLRYRLHAGAMKSEKLRGILRGTRLVKRHYFHRKMKWPEKGRYWAEGLLLLLPSPLVMRLFQRWQYRRD